MKTPKRFVISLIAVSAVVLIAFLLRLSADKPEEKPADSGYTVIVCNTNQGNDRAHDERYVLGKDQTYLFALSYEWNQSSADQVLYNGLYYNNDTFTPIYTIPTPIYESNVVISADGRDLWICTRATLPFYSDEEIDMTIPVIQKYMDGQLHFSLSLQDIYGSKDDLDYVRQGHGSFFCNWSTPIFADASQLTLVDAKTSKQYTVDSESGTVKRHTIF